VHGIEKIKLDAKETLLTVTGHGAASIAPDTATVFVAVVTSAASVRDATGANEVQMRRVIEAFREAGVAKRDIRTHQLRVLPLLDHPSSGTRIRAYDVRNGVTVHIRNLDAASAIIAAAFEAGANDVQGPVWGTINPQAGIDEARAAALADAALKAEACASGLGMRVNRVLSVAEGTLSSREPTRHYRMAGRGDSGPPIEEGELNRSLQISASYALVAQ
jgi:uncharacterized protein